MRTNMGVRCMHIHTKGVGGESGTNKSAQELTQRDRRTVPHPAPPRDLTQGLQI